jgi:monothiol glutaredoxin
MALDDALRDQLAGLIRDNKVLLFMKGTRHFPQCGFSATVTQILDGLIDEYETVNVLKEPAIREGIKAYSNWPTIPQLYVDGKFVGGCDIVRELFQAGELHEVLGVEAPPPPEPPKITMTEAARKALERVRDGAEGTLRLEISSRFEHELSLDEPGKNDLQIDAGGVTILVDPQSAPRAAGVSIDWVGDAEGGFRIDNPNEPPRVRQLAPTELKQMLGASEPPLLLDVRTTEERAVAKIAGDRFHEDPGMMAELRSLDRESAIVVYCRSGNRSQAAGQQLLELGFKRVYNLAGGIEAWSRDVGEIESQG